ncbi:MAG: ribonuclease III domain-containing protein [Lachnospiraceae bacterium]|nr:ribonuclease III domain-containing protein [Lachnospiraceae bacterium]
MNERTKNLFIPECSDKEAGSYSPLILAFIGDGAYELAIRTMFVKQGNRRPKDLNREKSKLAKAAAQSAMMETLEPMLTEREADIYRRGRNAKSATMAKNASVTDYRRATGFEALIGYLYMTGNTERMLELIEIGVDAQLQKKTV